MVTTRLLRYCVVTAAACFMTAAFGQELTVRASVDRSSIRENESFTYVLQAEGRFRGEPDISPIERQFDLLSRSSNTRIEILNGQTRQVAEWIYQVIPKAPGDYVLPPVAVDGVWSNPVDVEVLPALAATDQPADVFMEVEVDRVSPYVQSQVVYTLRLFVGISTGRATLTAPQIDGAEVIIERLGEDRQYQAERGGRNFRVRERRYAIFPQASGELTIGPAVFEAMVIPNRGFSRVQRMRSDSLQLDVRAAVPPPPEYPNASWLPASALELSEEWVDAAETFAVGVPRTRVLTVDAVGLLETQLPEIEIPDSPGLRQYPNLPELDRQISDAGLSSRRTERYAVIAQRDGELAIPGAELPWWDVGAERWRVARIAPRTVVVSPSGEPGDGERETAAAVDLPVLEPEPNYWPAVSAVLAFGWLATLGLWLRSSRLQRARPRDRARIAERPKRASNRQLLRRLRDACARNDAEAAQQWLMQWAALRFEDSPPQSLGALAEHLPDQAAREIVRLESHLYGRGKDAWDGRGLAAALSAVDSVSRHGDGRKEDPLLPLYR